MLKITDVELKQDQIQGPIDSIVLAVGITDGFEYVNGKRTDNLTHKKIEAVMTGNRYEKILVKVAGVKHPLTAEMIEQNGGSVKVKFKNLTGKFYRTSSGEYALSCKADSVEVVA